MMVMDDEDDDNNDVCRQGRGRRGEERGGVWKKDVEE